MCSNGSFGTHCCSFGEVSVILGNNWPGLSKGEHILAKSENLNSARGIAKVLNTTCYLFANLSLTECEQLICKQELYIQ